jgi:hypothetical protein
LVRQVFVTDAPLAVHNLGRETVKIALRTLGNGANHSFYDVSFHKALARSLPTCFLRRAGHARASFNLEFASPAAFGGFFWSSTKLQPSSVRVERMSWPRCLKAVTPRETVGMETPSFSASMGVEYPPWRISSSTESNLFSMSNER